MTALKVALTGLNARIPVEMMCALGAFASANAGKSPREPGWRLSFREDSAFRDTPILWTEQVRRGAETRLQNAIETDRMRWADSPVLQSEHTTLLVSPQDAWAWVATVMRVMGEDEAPMLRGLIHDGVIAPGARTKVRNTMRRTPLVFTSGQQQFLRQAEVLRQLTPAETAMARITRQQGDPLHRSEGIPSMRWEYRASRQFALLATNPAKTPYEGEAGLEWLAWRGLRFFPVAALNRWTTRDRKAPRQPIMQWPIWTEPRTVDEVAGLIMHRRAPDVVGTGRAAICRSQYGYGWFQDGLVKPAVAPLPEFDRVVDRWRAAEIAFDRARGDRDEGIAWARRRGVSEMEMHRRSGWSRTLIRAGLTTPADPDPDSVEDDEPYLD